MFNHILEFFLGFWKREKWSCVHLETSRPVCPTYCLPHYGFVRSSNQTNESMGFHVISQDKEAYKRYPVYC